MSMNRLTGDSYTVDVLPTASGGIYQDSLTTDMLVVPPGWAAGTHTVQLNGTIATQPIPGDGDRLDVTDPLGLLSPAAPMVIVGKVAGVGKQISVNGVPADSITLSFAGSNLQFTFSHGTDMWIATAGATGTSPGAIAQVAVPADLTALSSAAIADNSDVFVDSLLVPWTLSKTSTATPDGITVVTTDTGIGRWLRKAVAVPQWTEQIAWGYNDTTGSDLNVGSPASPLKTLDEWCRRMRLIENNPYTIALQTDVNSSNTFRPSGWTQNQGPFGGGAISLNGTLTPIGGATGLAVTAATSTNSATNTQASLTSGAFVFAPFVGKLVVASPSGAKAAILADLGAGVARMTEWDIGAPAPGDTFDIVEQTSFGPELSQIGALGYLEFNNCSFPTVGGQQNLLFDAQLDFTYCRIDRAINFGDRFLGRGTFQSCVFTVGLAPFGSVHGGEHLFSNCGFVGVNLDVEESSTVISFENCIQGAQYRSLDGGKLVGLTIFGSGVIGVFDSPSDGVDMGPGAGAILFEIFGGAGSLFYGSGNTGFGLLAHDGSTIDSTPTPPTITGASGDLQVDGAATAIPPLVAGAVVPAASALATWADLAAPPFSGDVVNYTKLTRITTV